MEETGSFGSWSDPGDSPSGVVVPDLLQHLFSIEFLPYATPPPPKYATASTVCCEDDECDNDSSSSESSPQPVSPPVIRQRPNRGITPRNQISRVVRGFKRRVTPTPRSDGQQPPFLELGETPKRRGSSQQQAVLYDASSLNEHQKNLVLVQEESIKIRKQAGAIERRVTKLRDRAARLQKELDQSVQKIQTETALLDGTKERLGELDRMADESAHFMQDFMLHHNLVSHSEHAPRQRALTIETASAVSDTPTRRRANTAPTVQRTASSTFMRAFDLDVVTATTPKNTASALSTPLNKSLSPRELFYIDHDIGTILDKLFRLGYEVCTDESARFQPTRETQKILQQQTSSNSPATASTTDVLTWIGSVDHRGFGHDWPVVKTRGIVPTTPQELYDFLLDSSKVKLYNKMSQGRDDVSILQRGVDTKASESSYGFAGDARIHRMLIKPKMLPKTIEVLSLQHSKKLRNENDDSFMTVSRSVWEDDSGVHVESPSGRIRSEMLLGVQLLRPTVAPDGQMWCEMTTITHVFSPGVPEAMAKRFAPISATNTLRDVQTVFRQQQH